MLNLIRGTAVDQHHLSQDVSECQDRAVWRPGKGGGRGVEVNHPNDSRIGTKGSQLTSVTARRRAESHRFLAEQQCSIQLCFGQVRRSNRKLAGLSCGPFGSRSVPLVRGRNPEAER